MAPPLRHYRSDGAEAQAGGDDLARARLSALYHRALPFAL
jgi:hypothetical protein